MRRLTLLITTSFLLPLFAMAENDVMRGFGAFHDRDKGHCLLCHQLSASPESFQGNLGPSLDGIAQRMTKEELISRISDSRVLNPETIMPPYHAVSGLKQVKSEFKGKPVLTEQEVVDVTNYLLSITRE